MAHHVASTCLEYCLKSRDMMSFYTDKLKGGLDHFREGPDKHEHCKYVNQEMYDYVDGYLDMIYTHFAMVKGKNTRVLVERKVNLNWISPHTGGTLDAAIGESFGTLAIFDLKYGKGIYVSEKNNTALMIYALGAVKECNPYCYEDVKMTIYQPRCGEIAERSVTISVEDLETWKDEVLVPAIKQVFESSEEKLIFKAGDWCHFCPAGKHMLCSEIKNQAINIARTDFMALDTKSLSLKILPKPEGLSKLEVSKVLKFAPILKIWVKQVEEYAQDELAKGHSIPDWVLTDKLGNRCWIDPKIAKAELLSKFGQAIFSEPELKSPAQMEKTKGINKGAVKALWHKPIKGKMLTFKKSSAPNDDFGI